RSVALLRLLYRPWSERRDPRLTLTRWLGSPAQHGQRVSCHSASARRHLRVAVHARGTANCLLVAPTRACRDSGVTESTNQEVRFRETTASGHFAPLSAVLLRAVRCGLQ